MDPDGDARKGIWRLGEWNSGVKSEVEITIGRWSNLSQNSGGETFKESSYDLF